MARITKLEAKGFKSFGFKTELLFGENFNCILGPNGSGKCVTGDTLVQLADGSSVRIDTLVNSHCQRAVQIEDGWVAPGDNTEILSLGRNLKIEPQKIKAFVKRTVPEKLLSIHTRSGRSIKATPYHPLFILKEGKVVPIRADELKEGLRIAVPRLLPLKDSSLIFMELLDEIKEDDNLYVPWSSELNNAIQAGRKRRTWKELAGKAEIPATAIKGFNDRQSMNFSHLVKFLRALEYSDKEITGMVRAVKAKNQNVVCRIPWENSPEFSRLLGYLLAEGRLTDSNQILLTNGTEEIVQDYCKCVEHVFGVRAYIKEYKPTAWDVLSYSRAMITLLQKFGMNSPTRQKDISNIFLRHCDTNLTGQMLGALYSGDGYVSNNHVNLVTKSPTLAFSVQSCLIRLGVLPRVRDAVKVSTNSGFSGVYKEIDIYGEENLRKFHDLVLLKHRGKSLRLSSILGKKENTNVDLIEANNLVKSAAKENKLSIKKLRHQHPILDSYVYNGSTPSRHGLKELLAEVFPRKTGSVQLLETLSTSDIFWDEIICVEDIYHNEKWVYDLCVEPDHNFVANNIIVHNSNVIDALCFVMGKSSVKGMRAEKTINLIYNGGKSKNPAKEAEVSLYIDNSNNEFPLPEKEIKITRIIRDKQDKSEKGEKGENGNPATQGIYKINGKTRTRQQVLDLLSHIKVNPDGYNIILQGDIIRLVEMSLIERRQIIEEIAGISIYEEKKNKAIRELQKVEEKLNEADIILIERGAYLKELKKERDQAMKFKSLDDQLKSNKATLLHNQIAGREKEEAATAQQLSGTQKKIADMQKEIADIKLKIQEKKKDIEDINKEVEQKGEKEQVAIHREVEQLKVSLAVKKQRIDTVKAELKKLAERKSQLEASLNELKTKLMVNEESKKSLRKEMEQKQRLLVDLDRKVDAFKKKNLMDNASDLDRSIEGVDKKADALQEDIQKLREEQQNLLREKDRLEMVLTGIDEKIAKVLEVNKKNKAKLDELRVKQDAFKKAGLELNKSLSEDASLAAQLATARAKLLSRKEEKAKLEARNIGIREGIAGGVAITKIMELQGKKPGIIGLVSDLGQVSSTYAQALEAAAGQRLRSIVVEDDKVAADCIKYLRDNKFGVATFLPLNKLKAKPLPAELRTKKGQGIHGPAVDLITFDKRYTTVFEWVFEQTLVVEDVETARRIGIGEVRMVTLLGDLIERSGAMRGGFRQKSRELGFQDKELAEAQDRIGKELQDLATLVSNLEEKKTDMDELIAKLRLQKSELEGEISGMEKTLHIDAADIDVSKKQKEQIRKDLAGATTKLDGVMEKIAEKNKALTALKTEKQTLRNKINEMRNPAMLAELNAFDQKRRELQEELLQMSGEIKNFDSEIANIFTPEKENIERIFKQQDKEKKDFEAEQAEVQKDVDQLTKDLAVKDEQEKKFYAQFRGLFTKRTKLGDELTKLETSLATKEEQQRGVEQKANLVSLEQAKFRAELSRLREEFAQFASVAVFKDKSEEQIRKEIAQFDRMVQDIGAVNMKALDVYESAESDYQSLTKKKDTLGKEREDVMIMINEIDTKKTELFMRTFDVVNQNFKSIFSVLSTKGEAFLDLEDKKDPFNGGMTIKVRISSKKFLDIRSLSGGEKTLTALAFLFSVQDYEPAAFYILDEVDAALDKRNSEKLAKFIKAYSEKAQYIIISHNDAIISSADNLYGVSMNEDGSSKVTSLKI